MYSYVLTRHLKQNQVIHPPPPDTRELGKFRGEPVYPRGSVVSLKTAENWMRSEGRVIKEGSQALKFIKLRAGTVSKMRELEVLKEGLKEAGAADGDAAGEMMQGLYARSQTEMYQPDPVVNVRFCFSSPSLGPRSHWMDRVKSLRTILATSTYMFRPCFPRELSTSLVRVSNFISIQLPEQTRISVDKGIVKIARKLGFDFAEAVVRVDCDVIKWFRNRIHPIDWI